LLMITTAAVQLGLLLTGIGSDIDLVRFTCAALGAALLMVAAALYGAERHTYAGLRLPWPLKGERAWRLSHRIAGLGFAVAGTGLLLLAWLDPGLALLIAGLPVAVVMPLVLAAAVSALFS